MRSRSIHHVQDGIATRCVDLVLHVERRAVLTMGTAMNVHDQGVLRCRSHAQGLGEKCFHIELVVIADKRERFDFGDLFSGEELSIQVGELARRGIA
jgi:hypothetical protein